MRGVRRPPPPPPPPPPPGAGAPPRRPDPVDRQTKCPLLLRTFIKLGAHHSPGDYKRGATPSDSEVALHTWLDAPLRELAELLKDLHPPARDRTVRLSFAQVYPDGRGEPTLREVGSAHSVKRGADDARTLAELNFQPGDFLDVAIIKESAGTAPLAMQM